VLVSFTSSFHYNIYSLESVERTERCALPPCFYCCLLAAFFSVKCALSFYSHIDTLCVYTVSHAGFGIFITYKNIDFSFQPAALQYFFIYILFHTFLNVKWLTYVHLFEFVQIYGNTFFPTFPRWNEKKVEKIYKINVQNLLSQLTSVDFFLFGEIDLNKFFYKLTFIFLLTHDAYITLARVWMWSFPFPLIYISNFVD